MSINFADFGKDKEKVEDKVDAEEKIDIEEIERRKKEAELKKMKEAELKKKKQDEKRKRDHEKRKKEKELEELRKQKERELEEEREQKEKEMEEKYNNILLRLKKLESIEKKVETTEMIELWDFIYPKMVERWKNSSGVLFNIEKLDRMIRGEENDR